MEDAGLVDIVNTLLGFVPEEYRAAVQAGMALLYALAGFLAIARPILNRFVKGGIARTLLDFFDLVADKVALNSKPLAKRVPPTPNRKSVLP